MEYSGITLASERGGFFVDIGEAHLFYVELDDVVEYSMVSNSNISVVVRAVTADGGDYAVRVSWSKYKRVAQSKWCQGMEVCSGLSFVPKLHSSVLYSFGSTHVGILVRDYVVGVTAESVWGLMSDRERMTLASDVREAVSLMSENTCPYFMFLQGRNLSTHSPVQFLNYRVLLSMVTLELNRGDMRVVDMEDFPCSPVLSHQALYLDHIIVRDGRLAGLVGWGQCDYVPEIYDRMKYHFRASSGSDEFNWCRFMSSLRLVHGAPPPMFAIACMYYHYYLRAKTTPEWCRPGLDGLLEEVSDELLRPLHVLMEPAAGLCTENAGDRRSRRTHDSPDSETATVHEDPFIDVPSASSTTSEAETWDDWTDSDTVLGILDHLSVA